MPPHVSCRALLALGLLALLCALRAESQSLTCLKMGPKRSPQLCKQFYTKGAPIRSPKDTANTKYGQIQMSNVADTVIFQDRTGKEYAVSDLVAPTNMTQVLREYPLYFVKARIANNTVTRYSIILHVPFSTVMSAYKNTSFIGTLTNLNQPQGVNKTTWFRWDFGNKLEITGPAKSGTELKGNFVSLFNSTSYGQGCQPALCSASVPTASCDYYKRFFGNSSDMTLYWDPAMHMPGDTELVPVFSSKISYMARFIDLFQLLDPTYTFLRQFTFRLHGNPIGTPVSFNGTFQKTVPTEYC